MTIVDDLVRAARQGEARAVSRLISLVENGSPLVGEIMRRFRPYLGQAQLVGITGPPGVGKSTTVAALVAEYRARGLRVAVLAIDPSSPISGGAILGDRIRMQAHAEDLGVFVRSMASRGRLGGLSWATHQTLHILDGAGFDVVLVETVGIGQSEVEVASLVDSTVLLVAPGAGDVIQAVKAGVLEIADIIAVNKCDQPGAEIIARDLRQSTRHFRQQGALDWQPRIVKIAATSAEHISDLVDLIEEHRAWLLASGSAASRTLQRTTAEVQAYAERALRERMRDAQAATVLSQLVSRVLNGEIGIDAATDEFISAVTRPRLSSHHALPGATASEAAPN